MFTNILIISTILSSAFAQPYYINPKSVPQSTRDAWCQNQQTQCPLICLQTPAQSSETRTNDCDPDTLSYACVCSNGISPNISQYSQTIPYYICTEWGNQCVDDCADSDSACQASCRQDHPCGAQHPFLGNASTISPSSSVSAAGGGGGPRPTQTTYSGFADGSGDGQQGEGGAGGLRVPVLIEFGYQVGLPLMLSGLFFGFTWVL